MEAELEWVRDADDLEDAALDESIGPGADGGLGHAEVGRDLGVRPAAVGLEVLDDPLVQLGDVLPGTGRSDPRSRASVERHRVLQLGSRRVKRTR